MNRFHLGIVLETTGQPVRSALAAVSRLGVRGVQIDAIGDLNPDQLTQTGRRELKTLLRSHNLELAALNCPLRRGLDNPEQLQPRLEHLHKVMQLAVDLGPRTVVMPMPAVPTDLASPRALTLRESLLDLATFGDRIGVHVALEPGLDPGEKIRDYLATFDVGSLSITFDPANFLLNGFDPLSSVTALHHRVVYSHARDGRVASISGVGQEVPIGAGNIDWMLYFATLESIDYRGYLVVEREPGPTRFADVANGVKFLKRFISPLES